MAFGRGNMTKEMTGNRVKKMMGGGTAMSMNYGDDDQKKRREAEMAMGQKMAGGGKVRGSGCAVRGVKAARNY